MLLSIFSMLKAVDALQQQIFQNLFQLLLMQRNLKRLQIINILKFIEYLISIQNEVIQFILKLVHFYLMFQLVVLLIFSVTDLQILLFQIGRLIVMVLNLKLVIIKKIKQLYQINLLMSGLESQKRCFLLLIIQMIVMGCIIVCNLAYML